MKKLVLTAGAACALAALWALPSLAATAGATGDANATAANATTAATGADGTSGANTADATASGGAAVNGSAAGTTVNGNANASMAASNSLTIQDIDVNRPFGDTTVDQSQSAESVYANLSDPQRQDLQTRCSLISQNPSQFATNVPQFCQSYLDYWKQTHPGQ